MTTFLIDIWHDLREKRLWPVAVALLIGTLAIPVVLVKPAEAPPATDQTAPVTTAALPIVSPDPAIVDGSDLDTFDIKDPFGSKADKVTTGNSAAAGGDTSTGTSGASGDSSGGSSGGGGSAGGGGGGGGGGDSSGGGTRWFTYTVDVKFGARGEEKDFKGLEQLDLLPDDQNPVVSFMGMRDNAKTAVFFIVDPAFEADGEGECAPTPEDCRFIYLGVDDSSDEETLSAADGNLEFVLQLDKIHIKNISESDATGDSTPAPDTPAQKRQSKRQDNLLTAPLSSFR